MCWACVCFYLFCICCQIGLTLKRTFEFSTFKIFCLPIFSLLFSIKPIHYSSTIVLSLTLAFTWLVFRWFVLTCKEKHDNQHICLYLLWLFNKHFTFFILCNDPNLYTIARETFTIFFSFASSWFTYICILFIVVCFVCFFFVLFFVLYN